LKLAVLFGPEFRNFDEQASATFPAFDDGELLWWVDAAVTVSPTRNDTLTLSNRRYQQPAFSSFSVYEDITYDLNWKHKFDPRWSAQAGFRIYIGDWQAPVQREDWIYTPYAGIACALGKNLNADLNYGYDWVESQVPNTEGREFTRHLVSLGLRYTF
jgi:hypothetical protein